MWAIDPGGYDAKTKATALAVFERIPVAKQDLVGQLIESLGGTDTHWQIVELSTSHAPTLLARLMTVEGLDAVVCEGWRSTSFGRGGSTEPTAQTIGAIRWACDWRGIEIVTQANNIKTAGLAAMGRHGIELRGKNQHQRDAEMHGWNYVLRTLKV